MATTIAYENNMYRIVINHEGKYFPQVGDNDAGWSCFRKWVNYDTTPKNRAYKTERGAFKFLIDAAIERMDVVQNADVTTAEWHGDNWTRAYEAIKSAQDALNAEYATRYAKR